MSVHIAVGIPGTQSFAILTVDHVPEVGDVLGPNDFTTTTDTKTTYDGQTVKILRYAGLYDSQYGRIHRFLVPIVNMLMQQPGLL